MYFVSVWRLTNKVKSWLRDGLNQGTASLERNHLHESCKRYPYTSPTDPHPHPHWRLNSSAKPWLLPYSPGCFLSWWSEVKWKSLSHAQLLATPWTSPWTSLQARILGWVAVPFYRGSFQPRNRTQVSCIAGGFFTSWATREAWTVISS